MSGQTLIEAVPGKQVTVKNKSKLWARMRREKFLYLLIMPGLILFLVYTYIPMLGNIIAFQDYSPFKGFLHSDWVGMKQFAKIFDDKAVIKVIWRTLYIAFLQILFVFPVPIVLSLMLNEVRKSAYKRVIQSIVYLPHFLSWVIVVGMVTIFLRTDGIVNLAIQKLTGTDAIPYMTSTKWFIPLIILEVIWKESGWGTIIFLAALSAVNQELYESATVDGAGRFKQMWHITLPAIRSVIVILLILRMGHVLSVGFEQIFLHINPLNQSSANVLDTYVYFKGIRNSDYSFATAVSLFKAAVAAVLVLGTNKIAKRFGESGLF